MLWMMEEQEKTIFEKLILLKHCFLYGVYDEVRRKKTIFKKPILL